MPGTMADRPSLPSGAPGSPSPRVETGSLGALRRAVEDAGYAAVCFEGPSGSARGDVLAALGDALRPRCRPLHLPALPVPPGGLWMRVAESLELASGYDARRRVLRLAGDLARSGQALLSLVDDAHVLPADTLYALIATARMQPGFLLVLAYPEGERLAGPLPEDVALVRTGGDAADAQAALGAAATAPAAAPAAATAPPAALDEEVDARAEDADADPWMPRVVDAAPGAYDAAPPPLADAGDETGEDAGAPEAAETQVADTETRREGEAERGVALDGGPAALGGRAREGAGDAHDGVAPGARAPERGRTREEGAIPAAAARAAASREAAAQRERASREGAARREVATHEPAPGRDPAPREARRETAGRAAQAPPPSRPPWDPAPAAAWSRRRAERERRRERRRRLAFGAGGLLLGIVFTLAIDTNLWRSVDSALRARVAAWAPGLGVEPRASEGPGDVAAQEADLPRERGAPPGARERERGAPAREAAPRGPAVDVASPPRRPDDVAAWVEAPPPAAVEAPGAPPGAALPAAERPETAPVPGAQTPAAAPGAEPPPAAAPGTTSASPPAAAAPGTASADAPLGASAGAAADAAPTPPAAQGEPLAATPSATAETEPPAARPGATAESAPPAPTTAAAPAPSAPAAAPRAEAEAPDAASEPPPRPPAGPPFADGALDVDSDTPVLVEIDGQPFGPTPLDGIRLRRGAHRVLAHFPDGSVAQKTIYIDEYDVSVHFR